MLRPLTVYISLTVQNFSKRAFIYDLKSNIFSFQVHVRRGGEVSPSILGNVGTEHWKRCNMRIVVRLKSASAVLPVAASVLN